MEKQRVLILVDKNPQTSFGRIARDFHQALSDDWDSHIFWLTSKKCFPEGSPDPEWSAKSTSFLAGFLRWRLPLIRKLKEFKPHWVIVTRPELGFLVPEIRVTSLGSKVSVMVHDTFAMTLYPKSPKFQMINAFYIKPMWRCHGILYNSRWTRDELRKIRRGHKTRPKESVIGCVLDSSEFFPPELSKEAIRKKWDLPTDCHINLNISLDEPRKNISTFFAMAQKKPEQLFLRVGDLSNWMQGFLQAGKIENVRHYQGLSLESLRELYALADVFVLPSLLEGFGYPAYESLACGTPVVASGTSALKENLFGYMPLVNPPENTDGFLGAIENLNDYPAPKSREIERLLEQFSPERFRERLLFHWEKMQA